MNQIYKEWLSVCSACTFKGKVLGWNYEQSCCPECSSPLTRISYAPHDTVMIATDDIPGGIDIRHGICHEDGTPKRYYSKTEIYRALNEKNLKVVGDTPGAPYRVKWSGRRDDAQNS